MSAPPPIAPSVRAERLPLNQVPVVDFRPFLAGEPVERKQAALELAGAFRNVGFAYLAGHGVDQGLIDDTLAEAGRFFALPRERKAEVSVEKSPCDRGWFDLAWRTWTPTSRRRATSRRATGSATTWPPTIRWSARACRPGAQPVAGRRARVPGDHGGLLRRRPPAGRPGHLRGRRRPGAARGLLRRLVHHAHGHHEPPALPAAGGGRQGGDQRGPHRRRAHSDYGCLALLAQDDRGGLQVRNAAGRWIDAKPVKGTFVVNVDDMLARWTNDLFPPTFTG